MSVCWEQTICTNLSPKSSPAELTTGAFVQSGMRNVFRYIYGIHTLHFPELLALMALQALSSQTCSFSLGQGHGILQRVGSLSLCTARQRILIWMLIPAVGGIFGTFNASTATPAEVTLSGTMQTIWADFMKNPAVPPAINWPRYVPINATRTLAKLAYAGNVQPANVVQRASSALNDGPCDKIWNQFINF